MPAMRTTLFVTESKLKHENASSQLIPQPSETRENYECYSLILHQNIMTMVVRSNKVAG